jgi:hypothetical protein
MSSLIGYGASRNEWKLLPAAEPDVCMAVRAEAALPDAMCPVGEDEWADVTYPEVLASVCPPARERAVSSAASQRRYSAVALSQRGSAKIAWSWFLAAPFTEKARWVGKAMMQPRRAAQWIAWQVRGAALKAR